MQRLRFSFRPEAFEAAPAPLPAYSAEEVTEVVAPNGAAVEGPQPWRKLARDSRGRTRIERPLFLGPGMPEGPVVVEIGDPVAGCRYTLDSANRIAHRWCAAAAAESVEPLVARQPDADAARLPVEILGARVVEGVNAHGMRRTTMIPSYDPNTPPAYASSEVWEATELKIAVRTTLRDPKGGERITRLKNLSKAEPAAAWFQIPDGYAIQDESGPFVVEFTIRN